VIRFTVYGDLQACLVIAMNRDSQPLVFLLLLNGNLISW